MSYPEAVPHQPTTTRRCPACGQAIHARRDPAAYDAAMLAAIRAAPKGAVTAWARAAGINYRTGIKALRRLAKAGLVRRVPPCHWRLTERGEGQKIESNNASDLFVQ